MVLIPMMVTAMVIPMMMIAMVVVSMVMISMMTTLIFVDQPIRHTSQLALFGKGSVRHIEWMTRICWGRSKCHT
jgi:hypothetical protein